MGTIGICEISGIKKPNHIQVSGDTKNMVINGFLDEYGRPKCEMILSTGKIFTHVYAVIDTCACDNFIDIKMAKYLNAVELGKTDYSNPIYGEQSYPMYHFTFAFKEREDIPFKSNVYGMSFDADFLIGTKFILEYCDLHIYRKERRFELIFN